MTSISHFPTPTYELGGLPKAKLQLPKMGSESLNLPEPQQTQQTILIPLKETEPILARALQIPSFLESRFPESELKITQEIVQYYRHIVLRDASYEAKASAQHRSKSWGNIS